MKKAIHNFQQLNLKNKLSKQAEQKQNHRYGEHWDGGRGRGSGGWGKGAVSKKYKLVGTEWAGVC